MLKHRISELKNGTRNYQFECVLENSNQNIWLFESEFPKDSLPLKEYKLITRQNKVDFSKIPEKKERKNTKKGEEKEKNEEKEKKKKEKKKVEEKKVVEYDDIESKNVENEKAIEGSKKKKKKNSESDSGSDFEIHNFVEDKEKEEKEKEEKRVARSERAMKRQRPNGSDKDINETSDVNPSSAPKKPLYKINDRVSVLFPIKEQPNTYIHYPGTVKENECTPPDIYRIDFDDKDEDPDSSSKYWNEQELHPLVLTKQPPRKMSNALKQLETTLLK